MDSQARRNDRMVSKLGGAACAIVLVGMGVAVTAERAQAHGGGDGSHFAVGYYLGHDGSYENPADPAWAPTLLVDTHPWELSGVFYDLEPVNSLFLNGWLNQVPGFEPLAPEDQEFNGHGFYSWLDPGYTHGAVNVMLHIDRLDSGLVVLNPDTLQPLASPVGFGTAFPHTHFNYFIDQNEQPALGAVYQATFHLSDAAGSLADSEPFTVQFRVVPEPASLTLLGAALALCRFRRRRRR